jgi:hypothetical protein
LHEVTFVAPKLEPTASSAKYMRQHPARPCTAPWFDRRIVRDKTT